MPDTKSFRFRNVATNEVQELEASAETHLDTVRKVLSSFLTDADRFADADEQPREKDDEEDTTIDDVESDGLILIVSTTERNEAAAATGDAQGEAAAPKEALAPKKPAARPGSSAQIPSAAPKAELKPPVKPNLSAPPPLVARKAPLEGQATELGWGSSIGTPGVPDRVTELNAAGKQKLMLNNRVQVGDDGKIVASAFVLGSNGELNWATTSGLTCKRVHLAPPGDFRKDHATSSYSEYEREWSKQAVGAGHFKVDIPLIFSINTSFTKVNDQAGFSKGKASYFQATNNLSMANLQLQEVGITDEFRAEIVKALVGGPSPTSGERLLKVFRRFGEFVASDQILGGRVSLSTTIQENQASAVERSFLEFQSAASARFDAEGVPIEAGAGGGTSNRASSSTHEGLQQRSLQMEVVGGIGRHGSSKVHTLGQDWMSTVDRFENWSVIGFEAKTVHPILDFVGDLKSGCEEALRQYFLDRLIVKDTSAKGNVSTTKWFDEIPTSNLNERRRAYNRRIHEVYFQYEGCMDRLRTVWRDPAGGIIKQMKPTWHGGDHELPENIFTNKLRLDVDDEIVSAEIWSDNSVDAVRFKTKKNRSLPSSGKYGSSNSDRRPVETISAPRVRGFWGTESKYVDSFGFRYLSLGAHAESRDYLLILEPTLFPV